MSAVACAVVLGVAGGTAVGYDVQAGRPPVQPGTLSQPALAYPAKAGGRAVRPPAEQDAGARTSGDLRKALLPVPAGAVRQDVPFDFDGWLSMEGYADRFVSTDAFSTLSELRFRRAVDVYWTQRGKPSVDIVLAQLRPGTDQNALQWVDGLHTLAGSDSSPLDASTNGFFTRNPDADGDEVFLTAARGDTILQMDVAGPEEISDADVQALVRRQLERI